MTAGWVNMKTRGQRGQRNDRGWEGQGYLGQWRSVHLFSVINHVFVRATEQPISFCAYYPANTAALCDYLLARFDELS